MYFQKIVGIFYKFEKNKLSQQINDCSTYIFNVCWNRIDMDVFILLILAENKISDNFSVFQKKSSFFNILGNRHCGRKQRFDRARKLIFTQNETSI